MTAFVTAFAAFIAVLASPPPPVELPLEAFEPSHLGEVAAEAYVLYDLDHDLVLAASNADQRRAMASVTKLMTALVVVENAELGDPVTISESAAATGEAEVGLVAGEVWTVWELLNAIIVRSGNDAATALAQHVGGSVDGFAALMNAKAAELGMVNSAFVNPHGLDADGHYSSATDLVILGRAAAENPVIAQLARTRVVKFRPDPAGKLRRTANTNQLLGAFEGVLGLKTGYTSEAGKVLVSVATRDGRRLLAVVMGTEDHFADTRAVLQFGFDMYGITDRTARWLVAEQGGGGGTIVGPEAARLRGMPDLPTPVSDPDRSPTPLEEAIMRVMESLVPPVLSS